MATYKEIKGVTVQTKDEDPVQNVGSWSSGGDLNQAKKLMGGAGLTPTASIVFGGVQGSPPSLATTESYNGTSWTELNDMPQVTQFVAGMGTSTAAVAIGGVGGPSDPPKGDYVQEWNGSSWSNNPNAYPFAGYSLAGAGTATAAIISGGDPARTDVNTFDGTSFTSSTAMNTGRRGHGSVGTTTANLVVGGETPRTANTEIWNGSSWTEVNNYPAATQDLSAWGTSTSAIGALGYTTTNTANSASWDGTSWTATADLATARNGAQTGGLGTNNTEGLVAGGDTPPVTASTEEWGFPPVTAAVLTEGSLFLSGGTTLKGFGKAAGIPAATWASGGTANTAGQESTGTGTQTAAVVGGRYNGTAAVGVTELYNGSSWTEVNDMNTARYAGGFSGIQTSAILAGGYSTTNVSNAETWDGTNWNEVGELNTARRALNHTAGETSSSALIAGGYSTDSVANAESWNGSSWTEVNDLNTARRILITTGTATAALSFGGNTPDSAKTEIWDGTSWTELNDLNTARHGLGGNGITTAALAYGGNTGRQATESWNGTSWTEVNDLSTGRQEGASAGTAGVSALFGIGYTTARSATSEEFTADNTLSTVTIS